MHTHKHIYIYIYLIITQENSFCWPKLSQFASSGGKFIGKRDFDILQSCSYNTNN